MTNHPSTGVSVPDLDERARAITESLVTGDGARAYQSGVEDLASRLADRLAQVRNMALGGRTSKESFSDLAEVYSEAIDDLTEVTAKIEAALKAARDLALEVVADFEAAERQAAQEATAAAAAAAEAARAAELEAAVQEEVARMERERLAPIEAEVRERLTKTGAA